MQIFWFVVIGDSFAFQGNKTLMKVQEKRNLGNTYVILSI